MARWLHHVSGLSDFRVILLCCVTIVHGHFRRFGPFSEDFWWLSEYKCPKVLQTYQNVFWTFPKKFGKFPNLADDLRGGTFWTIILTRRQKIYVKGNKQCFWFCSGTFCVRNKCFPVCAAWKHNIHFVSGAFARPRNIMSNNVSATMCPRLPGPLKWFSRKLRSYPRSLIFRRDSWIRTRPVNFLIVDFSFRAGSCKNLHSFILLRLEVTILDDITFPSKTRLLFTLYLLWSQNLHL